MSSLIPTLVYWEEAEVNHVVNPGEQIAVAVGYKPVSFVAKTMITKMSYR